MTKEQFYDIVENLRSEQNRGVDIRQNVNASSVASRIFRKSPRLCSFQNIEDRKK
jgi:hypothetical protein